MGLDSIELLVTVEETFGISFTDAEAEKMRTVGDLYEGVWNKIKDQEQFTHNICKSAQMFYKLRTVFVERYKINRAKITPDTVIADIVPQENIKDEWRAIEQELGYKLPPLRFSKGTKTALFITGIVLIFLGPLLPETILNPKYWWTMPIAGIIATIVIVKLAQPLKTSAQEFDMRILADEVMFINYNKLKQDFGTNRKEMEKLIQQILHDRLGVEVKTIVPEASFVDDLGID